MSAENEKSILVARRMASVIGMSIGEPVSLPSAPNGLSVRLIC